MYSKRGVLRRKWIWLAVVLGMYANATVHMSVNWWYEVHSLNQPITDSDSPFESLLLLPGAVQFALGITMMLSILIADCLFVSGYNILLQN